MNLHITKSKNAESFYIAKSYTKANGKTSSVIVRKLGTLNQLIVEHGPTRDDVLAWAKNEVKLETEKYKKDQQTKAVQITFHSDHKLDMASRFSTVAVIFSHRLFITASSLIISAGNSAININLSMISTRSYLISSMSGS